MMETNEMKLLMALCDALGFEVEETLDYQEREEAPENIKYFNPNIDYPMARGRSLVAKNGEFERSEHGGYRSRLTSPIIDYKIFGKSDD